MPKATTGPGRVCDLGSLCQALDAPNLAEVVAHLAHQAEDEHWSYEEFLAACLERVVADRRSNESEDDNPLAPETVGVRLWPEYDDNPLAPVKEIEVTPGPGRTGHVPARAALLKL